jgi:chemotaxis methyl-accepting protein methylase
LEALLDQIRRERGLDLRSYKPSFVQRRLAVRLRARGCPDCAAYGQLLLRDPEEYGPLLNALTINLTRFFRDATTFQALEEIYLPELLKMRASSRRLRIWSAGCAAGEEPYSLAIMLREALGSALRRWQVEIIATDVDKEVLKRARRGLYDHYSFQGLAPRYAAWVERYFSPDHKRQLSDEVRNMVSFRHLDLVCDPPPANLDLLLCRNVLIYFDRELQDRLYRAFYEALRTEGLLVLGKTEILPMTWSQTFVPVDLREHIYRRSAPKQTIAGQGVGPQGG